MDEFEQNPNEQFEKARSDKEDEMYLQTISKVAEDKPMPKIKTQTLKPKPEVEVDEPEPEPVAEEIPEEPEEEPVEEPEEEEAEPEKNWEDPFENEDENCAVKKYVFAVSRDYVDMIDEMELDERSAYVNEAISVKVAKDRDEAKKEHGKVIMRHFAVAIVTVIVGVPLMFWLVNKSIDVTVNNYKYTQENFEKLYREKAKKDALIKNSQEFIKDSE